METSTQTPQESEFLNKIDEIKIKQESKDADIADIDISSLANYIFQKTGGRERLSKPLIRLIFEKLGMGWAVKVTTELISMKGANQDILAIRRSSQFGSINAWKG